MSRLDRVTVYAQMLLIPLGCSVVLAVSSASWSSISTTRRRRGPVSLASETGITPFDTADQLIDLAGRFDQAETEVSALLILRLMREKGDWVRSGSMNSTRSIGGAVPVERPRQSSLDHGPPQRDI
jgi:hypothetical protein